MHKQNLLVVLFCRTEKINVKTAIIVIIIIIIIIIITF